MAEPEAVVLVHGLWVWGGVMALLRRRIARCGYRTLSYSYPSMQVTLSENAERLARFCEKIDVPRLHFVGHSMGGVVVLCMLESARRFAAGRVVLAGTPYGGSFAATRLARIPGGRALLGCCLPEWLGRSGDTPLPKCDIGVVAGNIGFGLGTLIAPDMPRPNDGVVTVAETKLPEMKDHIELAINHTGMLLSARVAGQICAFLRRGAFDREAAP